MTSFRIIISPFTTQATMGIDPLHPRAITTTRRVAHGYTAGADIYAYNGKLVTVRTETLTFPAISSGNLESLLAVILAASFGRRVIEWYDRNTWRNARILALTHQQIAPNLHAVNMTVETETAE